MPAAMAVRVVSASCPMAPSPRVSPTAHRKVATAVATMVLFQASSVVCQQTVPQMRVLAGREALLPTVPGPLHCEHQPSERALPLRCAHQSSERARYRQRAGPSSCYYCLPRPSDTLTRLK